MRARTILILLVLAAAGVLAWALARFKSQPVEVQFARAVIATVHSSVPTNGKVEPIEWAVARAERSGPVDKILIQRGEQVKAGQTLVELDSSEARANLASAQAKIGEARAQLDLLARGGRSTDLADISAGIDRAKLDLANAQNDYDRLLRLEQKQAATRAEVDAAKQRIDQAKLQIDSFEKKKAALVSAPDRAAAQARLDDAQAAARLAQVQIDQSVVRAPIEGTVYQFDMKPGAYLNAGDTVASIGRLDRVRVNVNVDEPDLGRVAKGMPVVITWVAMPGRQWDGEVDRMPTQIVQLGTRQVGEVVCVIRNPGHELLPGTNVDVEIRAQTVENAVAIPKEAVRTEHGETGVYLLQGDRIEWRRVRLGVSNTTRTQVMAGVSEGDAVALFSEKALHDGMLVKPVFSG
ncbi:MAG TPA: efflux RND transporter periplasmic adaptor subunit [Bryobacteraceae bacterium]|nr:efflux RND transporter periplasmic adaptor subunit [Bryobacteraceae bacterium]